MIEVKGMLLSSNKVSIANEQESLLINLLQMQLNGETVDISEIMNPESLIPLIRAGFITISVDQAKIIPIVNYLPDPQP